jgi:hypothetical protein
METDDMVFVENVPSMTLISSFRKHPNEHLGQLPECQSKMSDDRDDAPYSTSMKAKAQLDYGKGGELNPTLDSETGTSKHSIENRAGSWRQWRDGTSTDHSIDSDISKPPSGTCGVEEQEPVSGRRLPFHAKISHSDSGNRSLSPPPPTCHHLSLATNESFQIPQHPVPPPVR